VTIVVSSYIEFEQWARTLFVDFPALNIPQPTSEDEWQAWAFRLLEENQLVNVPLPNNYDNWRIWAEFFVDSL
jgi:hypothetical protein